MAAIPAVFLDRDGTVIADRHYLSDPEQVELLPGAADAIARLNERGIPVILVTNQSGIGRGFFSQRDYDRVHGRVVEELARSGAHLDAVYVCPHAPDDACDCRKPAPGLFEMAAREHDLDLSRSVFIGDRVRDVQPALAWGAAGILVRSSHEDEIAGAPPGIQLADDLESALGLLDWPGGSD